MSKPITVPVVNHSTGEVWFGGERAGRVQRATEWYWSAHPHRTDESPLFASKKAAIAFLVDRVEMGDLRPDHYRRFGVSKATGSLAPMSKEYPTFRDSVEDETYPKPPQAAMACRNVLVNGEPRILVHHLKNGPVTYEGGRIGFRALPAGATVEAR